MYLEKLEIQGFKSFANKNVLVFPGYLRGNQRGITSVVGPNGSGKSNVADSVRWALGEQSMKTLRGKKSEDVIFSGSDKKGKLGMAEVSLHLNNEDRQAPIDYSQVVITRRLYRSGESEYLLNNSRVRLSDIQMMLARAKFGQKTYSVIGQGMVEGFLNTSLAERKEFFDEATGVKQYQIKRDESLNKLRASYENLSQADMLISEIEPRLKTLTRQVNRLKKRGELEGELKELQARYYRKVWTAINEKFKEYNEAYLELEKQKLDKDRKMRKFNQDLEDLKTESTQTNEFAETQNKLHELQGKKDELNSRLARLEAQLEVKLESQGKFDLSFLIRKQEELKKDILSGSEEIGALEEEVKKYRASKQGYDAQNSEIAKRIEELNQELEKNQAPEGEVDKGFLDELKHIIDELARAEDFAELDDILDHCRAVKAKAEKLFHKHHKAESSVDLGGIRRSIQDLGGRKDRVLADINKISLEIHTREERLRLLGDKNQKTADELESVKAKIEQSSSGSDLGEHKKQKEGVVKSLEENEGKMKALRDKLSRFSAAEEERRNRLFALQKNIQDLQTELNALNNKLNENKINSTRYETKLEDLEVEIREELGGLSDIRRGELDGELAEDTAREKIASIKRQLELIGGIDPEVENEYKETKERYDFLSGQLNDLTETIKSLEKVIKELDAMIRGQFDKEFKVIAKNFEKYFKILFDGGTARIIKVMDDAMVKAGAEEGGEDGEEKGKKEPEDDAMDMKKIKFLQKHNATGLAGIEIQACPPGKKISSITMLSGGERALTAIALISAIISANPSPFVVLDEVDAALDEANSERLAKILDELSHKTQFIAITHNRATMRRANILYGVTMGDDGVSKLLSIKLDEASGLARKNK